MYILGVGPGIKLGHHDTSAALLKDNSIVAACEEERFLGDKHARALFPVNSIKFCLKKAGITIHEVDVVASPLLTYENYDIRLMDLFKFHFGYSPKICRFKHHLCHAASSYYLAGFDDALILSLDYSGDNASGLMAVGKNKCIEPLQYFSRNNSLGVFYSMITQFLGFSAHNDEYKVMGLASYGNPILMKEMNKILSFNNEQWVFASEYNKRIQDDYLYTTDFTTFQEQSYTSKLNELLGPARLQNEPIDQRHKDIAASLQKHIEDIVIETLRKAIEVKPLNNFCFSGGLALNCKLNFEIIKSGLFEKVFIQPAAGDAGISLGAALLASCAHGHKDFSQKNIVYLGPSYTNDEIKAYLDSCKLEYSYVEEKEKYAAKLIANNFIVGWFQGRAEWGPRALGNRSILANPANPLMKDIVNQSIKFREEFRPFAPSVLAEKQSEYFCNNIDDPFMITLANVREDMVERIPSVVHFDNTSRIQTVHKDANYTYWKLIKHFEEITGVPVVLNTSLNINGMPLASRISEAVKVFFSSGMEYLFLGNYMLSKSKK